MKPDRWDMVALVGAGSLGGGVWALASAPWAFVLWGCIALALAVIHAAMPAVVAIRQERARGEE